LDPGATVRSAGNDQSVRLSYPRELVLRKVPSSEMLESKLLNDIDELIARISHDASRCSSNQIAFSSKEILPVKGDNGNRSCSNTNNKSNDIDSARKLAINQIR